jgi:hypothetical protein
MDVDDWIADCQQKETEFRVDLPDAPPEVFAPHGADGAMGSLDPAF